jgi:hypothetical protein
MNAPRTVFFWGFYVVTIGLILLLFPNILLGMFGLPLTSEPWVRVLGALAVGLGYYYIELGRGGDTRFAQLTVAGRVWFSLCLFAIVALGISRWPLILFGFVDIGGAAWTAYELRRAHKPVMPFTSRSA